MIDVGGQVVAAGFLAGFDQHHAARVRHALVLQRLDRGQRTEDRVAIIGAAAAEQLVALDHRGPRTQPFVPAGHFRLLVQVAIEQHGVGAGLGAGGRDLDEDQRRAAFQAHHFQLHARDRLRTRPGFHQLHRIVHVAVRHPVLVEHRRFVGDADVLDQLGHDLVVPLGGDEAVDLGGIHGFSGCVQVGRFYAVVVGGRRPAVQGASWVNSFFRAHWTVEAPAQAGTDSRKSRAALGLPVHGYRGEDGSCSAGYLE